MTIISLDRRGQVIAVKAKIDERFNTAVG